MKKLLLLCFMSLFFSLAHGQSKDKEQYVDYAISKSELLRFAFPDSWKPQTGSHPYEVQYLSPKGQAVIGIFVFKRVDLSESTTPQSILDRQIEEMKSKMTKIVLVEKMKPIQLATKSLDGGKTLTSALYTGEYRGAKFYYYFTLAEFDSSKDAFAIFVQASSLSEWENYREVFEQIPALTRVVKQ
ncbi:hypothetical protein [Budvicia aquatica]|uniref:PsbP C-terminal domain-containing protein n=1 Tax=Budvicia aquatica TaxID=82979 RepID=A0A2C6DTY6_9GAMM|nr:hypothetical protein [Budvicia aquatica]PHI32294.1 hypothetical protein CRN84_24730 [Budvicia aquatica]VFS45227.1 Uncharacterised protein [Budvicia aquatica]